MKRIKEGYGYWKIDDYPLGGCFRRAGAPIPLTELKEPVYYKRHGLLCIGLTADGQKVAVAPDCVEEVKHDA